MAMLIPFAAAAMARSITVNVLHIQIKAPCDAISVVPVVETVGR